MGTDYFWDGGIVSNTPLQHLLAQDDDNLNSDGLPGRSVQRAMAPCPVRSRDVLARHKDIMYSSRTRQVTDNCCAPAALEEPLL